MSPTVSVNLCCYNSEKYLRETMDSIVNQTYKDWELVIINDGSSDSTEAIVQEYINRGYPITYHYQQNHGLGYSRNEALRRSQGEFIAFIDHDDLWMPQKIQKQIPLFLEDDEVGIVISDTYFFNDNEMIVKQLYLKKKPPSGYVFRELLKCYFISLETAIIRREALNKLSYWFDERFKMIEERDLFTRISYNWKLAYIDEVLGKWRMHRNSFTFSNPLSSEEETSLMLEKYRQIFDDFSTNFAHEILYLTAILDRSCASVSILEGRMTEARAKLRPHLHLGYGFWVLYILSFFPSQLFTMIMKWRGVRPS